MFYEIMWKQTNKCYFFIPKIIILDYQDTGTKFDKWILDALGTSIQKRKVNYIKFH